MEILCLFKYLKYCPQIPCRIEWTRIKFNLCFIIKLKCIDLKQLEMRVNHSCICILYRGSMYVSLCIRSAFNIEWTLNIPLKYYKTKYLSARNQVYENDEPTLFKYLNKLLKHMVTELYKKDFMHRMDKISYVCFKHQWSFKWIVNSCKMRFEQIQNQMDML